jgi:hypothetical protein
MDPLPQVAGDIFDSYEVFLGRHREESRPPGPLGRPPAPQGELQLLPRAQLPRALSRTDSDDEASFMLKVLNYPNIFYESLPAGRERSDSHASNVLRKFSLTGPGPVTRYKGALHFTGPRSPTTLRRQVMERSR